MSEMRLQTLFRDAEIGSRIRLIQDQASEFIRTMSDATICSKSVDDWLSELCAKYRLDVPVLDTDSVSQTQIEAEVPLHPIPNQNFRYSDGPRVKGLSFTFHIPYKGNQSLFYVRPSRYSPMFPSGATDPTELRIFLAGGWLTPDEIHKHVDRVIREIQQYLDDLQRDANRFNNGLAPTLRPQLETRRRQAEQNKALAVAVKYPLKRRPDASNTHEVPAIRRKIAATTPPAPPKTNPDPVLLEEHYQHILGVMESMSKVMERSPAAFEKMEEEHVRFHFLVQLNAQYDGDAVGEAFNFQGKTDILVRQAGHNLFIAECKVWNGPSGVKDTIDQLLRYVTWRDTKTAIVYLVKQAGFLSVVNSAKEEFVKHPQFVSGPVAKGDARAQFTFRKPDERDMRLTITLMLFHIPPPKKS